jgi:hypothetical protein
MIGYEEGLKAVHGNEKVKELLAANKN